MKGIKYIIAILCLWSMPTFGYFTLSPKVGVFYPWDYVLRSLYASYIPTVEIELALPIVVDEHCSSLEIYLSEIYMQRNGDSKSCDFSLKMLNNFVTLGVKSAYFAKNLSSNYYNIGLFFTSGLGARFFWGKEITDCPFFQEKIYISRFGGAVFQGVGIAIDRLTMTLSGELSVSSQRARKRSAAFESAGREGQLGGANINLAVGMDF